MNECERIKEVRTVLNLTLEAFGARVGVTKVAISNIEKGNRNITEQMRKAICREFNVNYDYLVYGEGEMFSDLPQTILDELCVQYHCDSSDRKIIHEYLKLNADSRKILKDYMRSIFAEDNDEESDKPIPLYPESDKSE